MCQLRSPSRRAARTVSSVTASDAVEATVTTLLALERGTATQSQSTSSVSIHCLPCPALLCPTLPYPALLCQALPSPALPCLALSGPTLPCPARPCPALPCADLRKPETKQSMCFMLLQNLLNRLKQLTCFCKQNVGNL